MDSKSATPLVRKGAGELASLGWKGAFFRPPGVALLLYTCGILRGVGCYMVLFDPTAQKKFVERNVLTAPTLIPSNTPSSLARSLRRSAICIIHIVDCIKRLACCSCLRSWFRIQPHTWCITRNIACLRMDICRTGFDINIKYYPPHGRHKSSEHLSNSIKQLTNLQITKHSNEFLKKRAGLMKKFFADIRFRLKVRVKIKNHIVNFFLVRSRENVMRKNLKMLLFSP